MKALEVITESNTVNKSWSEVMLYWKTCDAADIPEHTSISAACGHTDSHKSINSKIS